MSVEYICSICKKEVEQIDYGIDGLRWFRKKPVKYMKGESQICEDCYSQQKKNECRVYILNPELDLAISEPQKIDFDIPELSERFD